MPSTKGVTALPMGVNLCIKMLQRAALQQIMQHPMRNSCYTNICAADISYAESNALIELQQIIMRSIIIMQQYYCCAIIFHAQVNIAQQYLLFQIELRSNSLSCLSNIIWGCAPYNGLP